MSVRFRFKGANRVKNKLRRLSNFSTILNRTLRKWGQQTRKKLAATPYPPERQGQRYKRTGRFSRSWGSRMLNKLSVMIQNSQTYSGEVAGPVQGFYFVGRWWQAHRLVEQDHLPLLTSMLIDEIQDA